MPLLLLFSCLACQDKAGEKKSLSIKDLRSEIVTNTSLSYVDPLKSIFEASPHEKFNKIFHTESGLELGVHSHYTNSFDYPISLYDPRDNRLLEDKLSNYEFGMDIIHCAGDDSELYTIKNLKKEFFVAHLSEEEQKNGIMMQPELLELDEEKEQFLFSAEIRIPGKSEGKKVFFQLDPYAKISTSQE